MLEELKYEDDNSGAHYSSLGLRCRVPRIILRFPARQPQIPGDCGQDEDNNRYEKRHSLPHGVTGVPTAASSCARFVM